MLPLFNRFYQSLIQQSKLTPTFFLTYEQLVLNPEPVVKDLFRFLLDAESIEGTLVEAQIKKVCGQDHKTHSIYQLKADTGKLCARRGYYTPEQLQQIDLVCREYMHYFGYASHPDVKEPTQFSIYTDQTAEELASFKQFLKSNENLRRWTGPKERWNVNGGNSHMGWLEAALEFRH